LNHKSPADATMGSRPVAPAMRVVYRAAIPSNAHDLT